jgi:phosphatidylglycerol:prolipoprotein diacylglycerol transferase
MFTVLLSAVLVSTWWRKLPLGTYAVVVPLAYAPVRFVMDFYRILEGDGVGADLRYGSLTFAQWCCIALLVFGVAMAARVRAWHKQGLDLAAPVRQGPVPATAPSAATGTLGA